MADPGLTVPLKVKIENIDEEIRTTSEKLASLNSLLKTITKNSIGDLVGAALNDSAKIYEEQLKKAKEAALKEIDDKAEERLNKAYQEASEKYKKEAIARGDASYSIGYLSDLAGTRAKDAEAKKIEAEKEAKEEELDKKYEKKSERTKKAAEMVVATTPNELDKEVMGLMKDMSDTLKGLSDSAIKFTKQIFNIVEDVYKEMRNASPLLQTMETLFNLAWQMFFMPLGNKLGEILIPAVIRLLENVMEMWDKFEGMDLGEMISFAIKEGVTMMASYFSDIGGLLAEQSDVVGDIGKLLQSIGAFIEKYGLKLVELVMNIVSFVIEHINVIIMGIFELMLTSVAALASIHMSQMVNHLALIAFLSVALAEISFGTSAVGGAVTEGATASASTAVSSAASTFATMPMMVGIGTFIGVEAAGNAAGAYIGNKVGLGVSPGDMADTAGDAIGIGMGIAGLAEGGHVAPEPDGVIVRVAEAGEGEWMIPDSKMESLLKGDALPELGLHPLSEKSDSVVNDITNYSNTISNISSDASYSSSNRSYFGMDRGIYPSTSNISSDYVNTSNISMPSSSTVINLYIEGYTDEDLGDKIVRKLNEEMNLSRLRGGF